MEYSLAPSGRAGRSERWAMICMPPASSESSTSRKESARSSGSSASRMPANLPASVIMLLSVQLPPCVARASDRSSTMPG
jgi:hypothetical protein